MKKSELKAIIRECLDESMVSKKPGFGFKGRTNRVTPSNTLGVRKLSTDIGGKRKSNKTRVLNPQRSPTKKVR